jgi:hypothetical protein
MPDIQTELEKIIRSWDQEEKNEVLNLLDSYYKIFYSFHQKIITIFHF